MSKFFTVNRINWIKGLGIAIIMSILTAIYQKTDFQLTWDCIKPVLFIGFGSGKAYIFITLIQNSQGKFLIDENNKNILKEVINKIFQCLTKQK